MKEQNYNLNNLGNTFYLFKRDDEKMIDDIKKFALKYRNKIESDLGLDNTQAGFIADNSSLKNKKAVWQEPKKEHKKLMDFILSSKCHFILL